MTTLSTTHRPRRRTGLLTALLLLGAAGCHSPSSELPSYAVELRLGGALPDDDRVGDYTVQFTTGRLVLGDWWIYGMDREAAGYAAVLKHAGHIHGEADFETHVEQTFAVDLLGEPVTVATPDLTEGHYFDGSIRLRPATELYAPIQADDLTPLSPQDELWGHSLILEGTATRDGSDVYEFRITVDAEAMITGLSYGSSVWEFGAAVITTELNLGALLQDVDFAALADSEHRVTINATNHGPTYTLLKARLQEPALYRHTEAEAIPQ